MKILVGYKGVNVGKDLIEIAARHARAFDGQVIVVTSMKGGGNTDPMEVKAAEDNLEGIKPFFKEKNIPCDTHLLVRGMEPGEDIVAFAEENKVDEIIIGVRSRSKVGKLLFGSTSQVVILQANCPVVTVK
ncbi:universal stress protein [Desulfotignum balticum]|jgi:nucleotide-binding universal stress UspA family protein|uniref:Universal stress protein n=1 Tax=Desulfotignum balticum TaxID=115781 RepID=A0A931CU67_9BACT|nr:universal stress protein [Desulfotignum balticum]MBG0778975.1 universal stress protein [Desulfotignum balticum]